MKSLRVLNNMKEVVKRITDEFHITRDEAELIVATLLGRPRFEMYADNTIDGDTATMLSLKLIQLKKGIPIEYITKRVQFMDFLLAIYPGVFIPRVESEYFIELITQMIQSPPETILDIGTGCGALSIALAQVFPDVEIVATDISSQALRNAAENIERFSLKERIVVRQSNLFENISSKFDLIVSNPPYIPVSRLQLLPKSVRNFEPIVALNGGEKGVQFIKRLLSEGAQYLNIGGMLAIEIDADQVEVLTRILHEYHFASFSFKKDLFGRFRYLFLGVFKDEKS